MYENNSKIKGCKPNIQLPIQPKTLMVAPHQKHSVGEIQTSTATQSGHYPIWPPLSGAWWHVGLRGIIEYNLSAFSFRVIFLYLFYQNECVILTTLINMQHFFTLLFNGLQFDCNVSNIRYYISSLFSAVNMSLCNRMKTCVLEPQRRCHSGSL